MTTPRLMFTLTLLAVIGLALLPACRSRCCDGYAPVLAEGSPSGSASDADVEAGTDESPVVGEAEPKEPKKTQPKRRRRINAQALYTRRCARCHGGMGGGGKGPRLVGRGALRKFKTRNDLSAYVLENMPPQGPKLDEDEANALARFAWQVNGRR